MSSMLEKVAKLLAQAEGAATQAEADAFNERAQYLATVHSIDVAKARHITKSKENTNRERIEMLTITITDQDGVVLDSIEVTPQELKEGQQKSIVAQSILAELSIGL